MTAAFGFPRALADRPIRRVVLGKLLYQNRHGAVQAKLSHVPGRPLAPNYGQNSSAVLPSPAY